MVNYADDTVTFGSTIANSNVENSLGNTISNIKFITLNLTSNSGVDELNKSIILKAFSCNIGTSIPEGEDEL